MASRSIKIAAAGLIACAAIAAGALRLATPPQPVLLTQTNAYPEDVRGIGDDWYWVERPAKGKAVLIRARAGQKDTLASADAISGFDVDGDKIAVSSRSGPNWSVSLQTGSSQSRILTTSPRSIGRPCIHGAAVVWAAATAGSLPVDAPVPALSGSVEIVEGDGGAVKTIGSLPESVAHVLTVGDNSLIVAAERKQVYVTTVLYRIDLSSGKSQRLVGEQQMSVPMALKNGSVVYGALSQESASRAMFFCVRRVDPDGKITTLADWLPARGRVYVNGDKISYIGTEVRASIWKIEGPNKLPDAVRVPPAFAAVGVSDHGALIRKEDGLLGAQSLYTWSGARQ